MDMSVFDTINSHNFQEIQNLVTGTFFLTFIDLFTKVSLRRLWEIKIYGIGSVQSSRCGL